MSHITCVSMCGNYHAKKDWYPKCAKSWSNITDISYVNVIDDGNLSDESASCISKFGHHVLRFSEVCSKTKDFIENYPNIKELRNKNNLIRKILDPNILFRESKKILFIDSDVYIRKNIRLPVDPPDILFTSGDVSGYGGHPFAPLRYPVVLGLNSGVVLWSPEVCDWDLLEEVAKRGMLETENKAWWIEQFCWAFWQRGQTVRECSMVEMFATSLARRRELQNS